MVLQVYPSLTSSAAALMISSLYTGPPYPYHYTTHSRREIESQVVASALADAFNDRRPPKPIAFIMPFVIELPHRDGRPLYNVEPLVSCSSATSNALAALLRLLQKRLSQNADHFNPIDRLHYLRTTTSADPGGFNSYTASTKSTTTTVGEFISRHSCIFSAIRHRRSAISLGRRQVRDV